MSSVHTQFAALRTEAAAFNASNPDARKLQSTLLDWAGNLHRHAAAIFGAPVADYFRGDSVRPSDVLTAIESLTRLVDHNAPPRARTTDAPVTAATRLEGRVASLEFRALEQQRVEKASALYDVLKSKLEPFAAFLYDGADDWTWADFLRAGLVRATVVDWKKPDKAGLADLEAVLRGPVGNPEIRAICMQTTDHRRRVAALWEPFEEYARNESGGDDLAEAYNVGFDADRVCTLTAAHDDIDAALTAIERWGGKANAWHRKQWVKAEAAKLARGQTEFG